MRGRIATILGWALLLLSLAPTVRATPVVVADPFPPARFTSLYIERYDKGKSTSIRLAGDAVAFKVTSGKEVLVETTVHPSADDWFQFIKGLNDARVYKWAPKYYYPGQGETWVIDMTMDDRKFLSGGTNDYPLNDDPAKPQANPSSGPSIPFQLFWQAVLKLAGQPPLPAK